MTHEAFNWIVRGLVVAVPIIVFGLQIYYASVAIRTFERGAIRHGKLLGRVLLVITALHPAYLLFEAPVDVPSYYFASGWICALFSSLTLPPLAIAEIEASRGSWRSPRYAELSKAHSEEVELEYMEWRRQLVRLVLKGRLLISSLRGAAGPVVRADLPAAMDAEDARLEAAREREFRKRMSNKKGGMAEARARTRDEDRTHGEARQSRFRRRKAEAANEEVES